MLHFQTTERTSNSYRTVCLRDRSNPRALASGLSHVHVDKPWHNYFIPPISVSTLHSRSHFVLKLVRVVELVEKVWNSADHNVTQKVMIL